MKVKVEFQIYPNVNMDRPNRSEIERGPRQHLVDRIFAWAEKNGYEDVTVDSAGTGFSGSIGITIATDLDDIDGTVQWARDAGASLLAEPEWEDYWGHGGTGHWWIDGAPSIWKPPIEDQKARGWQFHPAPPEWGAGWAIPTD